MVRRTMRSTVKFSITARRAAGTSRRAQLGVAEQFGDGGSHCGGLVIHQQPGFAIAHDFGQSAHAAGDHRHGRRHGQQRAEPSPSAWVM